jgi:glutamate dehydrogenase
MDPLAKALETETSKFTLIYEWLQKAMPSSFATKLSSEEIHLIAHNLMDIANHDYFTRISTEDAAFILCLDEPFIDSKILSAYTALSTYTIFLSNIPFLQTKKHLKIAKVSFAKKKDTSFIENLSLPEQQELLLHLKQKASLSSLEALPSPIPSSMLQALHPHHQIALLTQLLYAKQSDHCCYEMFYDENLHLVLAWKGIFLPTFLHRLFTLLEERGLQLIGLNAAHIDEMLLLSFSCKGTTDIDDLIQEITTLPYFEGLEKLEKTFIHSHLLSGNTVNILKAITYFIHQSLLHCDVYAHSLENIEEDLCRYPNLTSHLMELFSLKFHPEKNNLTIYEQKQRDLTKEIEAIDTGDPFYDTRRKKVLHQVLLTIEHILKTNAYHPTKMAICFRLCPEYLRKTPCSIADKFPSLPYGIFFMKGFHFLGFHVRFADLARGGLRTVFLQDKEKALSERNKVFTECYNLAYTQNKKNKDIPEGGAKGIIFIEPMETKNTAEQSAILHHAQKAYVESLLSLVNCHTDGSLRATHIIDYLKKPEYIYLGPDENMHTAMISWIAAHSKEKLYFPGTAFISSKPKTGINHKEFGVTSLGVNVYMEETLHFLGINPKKECFSIKMTGGPDGDVAGNQMLNLFRFYPNTAKLLTTVDVSGVIFDPKGLDLKILAELFAEEKPICYFPKEKLSKEGFFIDSSSPDFHHILSKTIYQTKADIFIPGGGRPNSVHEGNIAEFMIDNKPSVKAVIEGANLYLTPGARRALEKEGTLVLKDSSANKGGVTCSSFEVLAGLCLTEEEFLEQKAHIVQEILNVVEETSRKEAQLILSTHTSTKEFLTDISEKISAQIHRYKQIIIEYLNPIHLSSDLLDPFNQILLAYALPTLRTKYPNRVLLNIPEPHKKAIIACYIASHLVYKNGLSWEPKGDNIPMSLIEESLKN